MVGRWGGVGMDMVTLRWVFFEQLFSGTLCFILSGEGRCLKQNVVRSDRKLLSACFPARRGMR